MINEKLDILRDTLLQVSVLDSGFANVQKVPATNLIIDAEGQEYAGINDKDNGNFYIRPIKDSTFTLLQKGVNKRYKVTTPCEVVFTIQKVNVELFASQGVPIISDYGVIKRLSTDSAEIYMRETGDKNPKIDFRKWQLIKIEFDVQYTASSIANCLTNLCKC